MSGHAYERATDRDVCDATISDEAAVAEARAHVPPAGDLAASADVFTALGDPTRLRILFALARTELCVCDLVSLTGISQSGVSHQLRFLRDRRLVAFRREGKRALYRLADDHVRALLAQGLEHAEELGRGDGS